MKRPAIPTTTIPHLLLAIFVACAPPASAPPPPASQTGSAAVETGSFAPDPNEPSKAFAQFLEARRLINQGREEEARKILEAALKKFPESRHLHQEYAELLWHESKGSDPELLRQSAAEAVRAAELGLLHGKVDYTLTARLAETLGRTRDKTTLDQVFRRIIAKDPSSTVHLDYATGLALTGDDKRAEDAFQKALQSAASDDPAARYGEWLLDRKRDKEALDILPKESPVYYIHFLRGVALDRLGLTQEARREYDQYREYSKTFPAPARFRIAESAAQNGIRFEEQR